MGGLRRRDLLEGSLGVAGTLVAAGGVPAVVSAAGAYAEGSGDASVIADGVMLEQNAAYAYGLVVGQRGLDRAVRALLDLLRAHETEHAGAMITLLSQAGGNPPARPRSAAQLDPVTRRLARARGRAAVLEAAIALEQAAVAGYRAAAQELRDARMLESVASIMASEGQHLVALRLMLHRDPIPDALVTGTQ